MAGNHEILCGAMHLDQLGSCKLSKQIFPSRSYPSRRMLVSYQNKQKHSTTNDKVKHGSNRQQCKQTAVIICMPRCLLHQAVVSSPITRMVEVAHPMTKLSSKITLTAITPAMMTERDVLRMKRKITPGGCQCCACSLLTACLIRVTNSRKQAKPAHARHGESGCDRIVLFPNTALNQQFLICWFLDKDKPRICVQKHALV